MQNSSPSFPDEYHLILQSLPDDGSPVAVTLPDEAAVQAERLRYYNFLKWCRRPINRIAVTHLAGRYNHVTIACKGNQMVFRLKTPANTTLQSPLASAFRNSGLAETLPPVPRSANPHAFTPVPRGETTPLIPEFDSSLGIPAGGPRWDGIQAEDKKWMDKEQAKLIARSEYIQEHGIEEEVKSVQWFPAPEVKSLPVAWKRCHPQFMLQEVMDELIFSGLDKRLSFPVDKEDTHRIDTKLVAEMTQAWSDYFVSHGMMDYVAMAQDEVQWIFSLTPSAIELLDAHELDVRARRNTLSISDMNDKRRTIINLFKE